MGKSVVGIVCVILAGATIGDPAAGQDTPPAEELLPSGVWKLEVTDRVNGAPQGDARGQWFRLRVIRNRLSGHPADDEPDRARLAGEVVAGKVTVVTWRQDNSNVDGYSQFCTGKVVEKGKVVGTWHDTWGQSGDFVLTLDNN